MNWIKVAKSKWQFKVMKIPVPAQTTNIIEMLGEISFIKITPHYAVSWYKCFTLRCMIIQQIMTAEISLKLCLSQFQTFTTTAHYSKHEYVIVLGIVNHLNFCKTQLFENLIYSLHVVGGNIKTLGRSNIDHWFSVYNTRENAQYSK